MLVTVRLSMTFKSRQRQGRTANTSNEVLATRLIQMVILSSLLPESQLLFSLSSFHPFAGLVL